MRRRKRPALLVAWVLAALVAILLGRPSVVRGDQGVEEGATQAQGATENAPKLEISSKDELADKRIAFVSGVSLDAVVAEIYPTAADEFSYYNSLPEAIQAVKSNKADAVVADLPVAQLAVSRNSGLGIIPDPLLEDHYGFVLAKGSGLTPIINEHIATYHADGTIDALYQKWTGADDSVKTMPQEDWDAPNGTLRVVAGADSEPMSYQVGDEARGMAVEILCLVARDLGMHIDVRPMAFAPLISEVQSGKADVAAYCFSITEERKQVVDMSDPFYDGGVVAIVRADTGDEAKDTELLADLAASFTRTFITEGRWKLVLSGLCVTLVISVVSGALGLALGFALVMLRRRHGGADRIVRTLEALLGALPVVVVLMVFYYVVMGTFDVPAMFVATVVFTIMFAASSGSVMWNAIRAVDAGQTEAGRALGFSDRNTFVLVVLPQAARQFAPLLVSQFVGLVKDTSVVGYIAVQDLTRVGDLIRARTMEAFFPLIAVAVIYFTLCRLMAWLLDRVLVVRLEPQAEPRTIKGVSFK